MTLNVLVWIAESTWGACVDAARAWAPETADIALLSVTDDEAAEVAHGAFLGLLSRGRHPVTDPGRVIEAASSAAAMQLLDAAATRLARPATRMRRSGRVEHEVVAAAVGADLLVCCRDGERGRLGPRSLGPATRFVVDHAPCPVLLVWPEEPPGTETLVPLPPRGERPPPPR